MSYAVHIIEYDIVFKKSEVKPDIWENVQDMLLKKARCRIM